MTRPFLDRSHSTDPFEEELLFPLKIPAKFDKRGIRARGARVGALFGPSLVGVGPLSRRLSVSRGVSFRRHMTGIFSLSYRRAIIQSLVWEACHPKKLICLYFASTTHTTNESCRLNACRLHACHTAGTQHSERYRFDILSHLHKQQPSCL